MNKHKFNIFPEAKPEDFKRLKDDIEQHGYDEKQPITVYQGGILDGWNRQRACDELGIAGRYVTFAGGDAAAIEFVMRTNKRRNLNSGQWACIAAEADELLAVIAEQVEKERREKQAAKLVETLKWKPILPAAEVQPKQESFGKIISQNSEDRRTAPKVAALFNTNRTYVNQAVKMKEAAPEVFEKVKAGKMTMQDANRAVRAIPSDPWSEDERERQALVEAGTTVVANTSRDKNLIQWAESKGLAVRVDRGTDFGNPFILNADGDRDQVCDSYCDHYLPHKPSIVVKLKSLKGKVLICHCFPERCHADSLANKANQ